MRWVAMFVLLLCLSAAGVEGQHKRPSRRMRQRQRAEAVAAALGQAPPPVAATPAEEVIAPPVTPDTLPADAPLQPPSPAEPAGVLPAGVSAAGDGPAPGAAPDLGFVVTSSAGLPAGVHAASVTSACGYRYLQTDLRPLRMQWNSSYGFCGETSVQMIALARGVWISQRQARTLSNSGGNDLILDSRDITSGSIYPLLKNTLGWNMPPEWYWDMSNQSLSYDTRGNVIDVAPRAPGFLGWAKGHIMAGRPVIIGVRLSGGPDQYYDHIVPLFAMCTGDTAAVSSTLNNATDAFTMTTNLKDETNRSATDPGMYAKWKQCVYSYDKAQVGCVPNDIYNYGVAMADIKDTAGLTIRTTRLFITGWSNGFDAQQEPGEASASTGNSVTAKYSLLLWNLTRGKQYKTYRISGAQATIPATKTVLSTRCGTTCKSVVFNATATSMSITETSALGTFPANSVQYFLTVTYP